MINPQLELERLYADHEAMSKNGFCVRLKQRMFEMAADYDRRCADPITTEETWAARGAARAFRAAGNEFDNLYKTLEAFYIGEQQRIDAELAAATGNGGEVWDVPGGAGKQPGPGPDQEDFL